MRCDWQILPLADQGQYHQRGVKMWYKQWEVPSRRSTSVPHSSLDKVTAFSYLLYGEKKVKIPNNNGAFRDSRGTSCLDPDIILL